ncbi:MAG: 4-hydroxythreonine-4-phosphate dehydrogenase PdxA [Verrucomicrobia bacterium]|nr:MAG: 4-hydroxythreonine-4-phosphate dehydrogenase PdxA [Verrucomicrobiota bacterium]
MPLRIGITLGDPAGVGPEIIRAALASEKLPRDVDCKVIGDVGNAVAGTPTADSARVGLAAMEEAVALAISGEIDAITTAPIHKARMAEVGFALPGQTEFFAARSGTIDYAMLLTGGAITVALVTTHVPLRDVPELLKTSEIVRVGKLLDSFLRRRGIAQPRIAVAGLNPHAGESGKLGHEEIAIIAPAISELNHQPSTINYQPSCFDGPVSPDTLFFHLANGKWDAALCMYHDQGLIPLKLHAFHSGVNVTLGLPFPRTSPDHGTAFDIAGKGIARPDSMIAAINLAAQLVRHRT